MRFKFCGDLDCPDWVLSEIATLSKLSSVRIKVLVVQIIEYCLQGTFNYEKVLKLAGNNADGLSDTKGAVAAVHFIVTNAAKHDLDDVSLLQEIQQLGLPKENSEAISKQYRDHKDSLRNTFSQESYKISRLLATDWRLDHIVSSSPFISSTSSEATSDTLVHLRLIVDAQPHASYNNDNNNNDNNISSIDVTCELTSDKLDVLVQEIAHAHKILINMEN